MKELYGKQNDQQQGIPWWSYQTAKWKKKSLHMYGQKNKSPTKKKNLAGPRLFHQKTMQQQSLERRQVWPERNQIKSLSRSGILKQERTQGLCHKLLLGEKYPYFSWCQETSGEAVVEGMVVSMNQYLNTESRQINCGNHVINQII